MKLFFCECGQAVFFESDRCVACGKCLGFDSNSLTMVTLTTTPTGMVDESGATRSYCANHEYTGVCNWLQGNTTDTNFCLGCNFNRTIPDLTQPQNLQRWARLEAAKKRVLYTLRSLALPVPNGHAKPGGLLFDFLEDSQSDLHRFPELQVHTGHLNGIITLNILEADDAAREALREALNENYRSLLGHMRHEFGHFFHGTMLASLADQPPAALAELRRLFGDERTDYASALEAYYAQGPRQGVNDSHITAYASSHPLEDWAETWGHYLHMVDVIETAVAHGVLPQMTSFDELVQAWRTFSVTLNELNRSMGLSDAYPFVLTPPVIEKLAFVDTTIARLKTEYSASADY